jgi:putative hydrolase of the HAD superfamily
MVLIFDLDDTLYLEITYVQSGFAAVAEALERRHGWDAAESIGLMNKVLHTQGRGSVFDALLASRGMLTRSAVRYCVTLYRHHEPLIALAPEAEAFLSRWPGRPYLVTDGHKVMQAKKVEALGIRSRFERVYITHRYGVRHAKPSPYCFDLIRRAEHCDWSDLVYVGDNPAKDFVSLNALGGTTVRVLTGEHCGVTAKPEHDGRHRIHSLRDLESLLQALPTGRNGDER